MKRTKIIASICASLLCLSALVMAVYAVISSSFAVKTTLTFDPNGFYVSVRGQVYRGDSLDNMTPLTTKESYTLATTGSSNTSDAAEPAEMRAWEPDVVNFLPSEKYVQFRLFVTNKGEQDVSFIPQTDISLDGLKTIEEASDTLRISSSETKEYKLTFYLTTDEAFELKEFNARYEFVSTSEVEISTISSWTGHPYVVFSNSVTSLSTSGVLPGASVLKAVRLSNKLTTLPSSLFSGCTSLTTVTIPEGVKVLDDGVFEGCVSLIKLFFPKTITSVGFRSFIGCSSLNIEVSEENEYYSSLGGSLYNKDKTQLIRGSAKQIINDIPSTVKKIVMYAFDNCTNLKQIFIPLSVTEIEANEYFYPFKGCSADLEIYCEAKSKPAAWGEIWNYYQSNKQLNVHWGASN